MNDDVSWDDVHDQPGRPVMTFLFPQAGPTVPFEDMYLLHHHGGSQVEATAHTEEGVMNSSDMTEALQVPTCSTTEMI